MIRTARSAPALLVVASAVLGACATTDDGALPLPQVDVGTFSVSRGPAENPVPEAWVWRPANPMYGHFEIWALYKGVPAWTTIDGQSPAQLFVKFKRNVDYYDHDSAPPLLDPQNVGVTNDFLDWIIGYLAGLTPPTTATRADFQVYRFQTDGPNGNAVIPCGLFAPGRYKVQNTDGNGAEIAWVWHGDSTPPNKRNEYWILENDFERASSVFDGRYYITRVMDPGSKYSFENWVHAKPQIDPTESHDAWIYE